MGAPFATANDLAALLQLDSVNTASADICLQFASDAVRAEVNQSIDLATTVETLDGPRKKDRYYDSYPINSVVFAHERPVHAVPKIQEYQNSVGALVTLVEYTDYTWDAAGGLYRISGGDDDNMIDWTRRRRGIIVTYTHGWSPDTYQYQLAKVVSTQVAARAYVNPEMVHEDAFGGYATRYKANSEMTMGIFEFTEHEKEMLGELRPNSLGRA